MAYFHSVLIIVLNEVAFVKKSPIIRSIRCTKQVNHFFRRFGDQLRGIKNKIIFRFGWSTTNSRQKA